MVKTKSLRALRLLPPNDSMPRANNGLVGANDSLAAANDQTARKRQRIFSTERAKNTPRLEQYSQGSLPDSILRDEDGNFGNAHYSRTAWQHCPAPPPLRAKK